MVNGKVVNWQVMQVISFLATGCWRPSERTLALTLTYT